MLSENLKIKVYRTVILPVVLNGRENWSLALREESRMLRRIFGPKRDEVTGEWRRLHIEEPDNLYSSLNVIWVIKSRRIRWAGHVAHVEEESRMQGFDGET